MKVVPLPTSLAAASVPPNSCTDFLAMAKPRPVPSFVERLDRVQQPLQLDAAVDQGLDGSGAFFEQRF